MYSHAWLQISVVLIMQYCKPSEQYFHNATANNRLHLFPSWCIVDSCLKDLSAQQLNWYHSSDTTVSLDCILFSPVQYWLLEQICCSKFAPDMDMLTWCADCISTVKGLFSGNPHEVCIHTCNDILDGISASPSKLFALHLHAISHVYTPPVFPCYYWTAHVTSHECMSSQITQIDSNFDFLWLLKW